MLSGTGADGSTGLRPVKAEGGMAMVQDIPSARYAGMPTSTIATDLADFVVPAPEMARQLAAYGQSLATPKSRTERSAARPAAPNPALQDVFRILHPCTGHDFSGCKLSTLQRRIDRRKNVHQLTDLKGIARITAGLLPALPARPVGGAGQGFPCGGGRPEVGARDGPGILPGVPRQSQTDGRQDASGSGARPVEQPGVEERR